MRLNTRVSIGARDATVFADHLRQVGFDVEDTGERITTDDGLDGEFVLQVSVPTAPRPDSRQAMLLRR